jgi:uncharacterized protein YihD (DUF1040 family)
MADALTTMIDKIQATLGDDGTVFTDAQVTAAVRLALDDWNERSPIFAAVVVDVVANQKEYEVTDEDAQADDIIDVLLQGTDTAQENHTPLVFDKYEEDASLFIRLQTAQGRAADHLIIRYTKNHTINGLDSEVESTLPGNDDPSLVIGGAYYSLVLRAAARIETINLQKDVSDNYKEIASTLKAKWEARLRKAAAMHTPVGNPSTYAWNDQWYGR